MPSEEETHRSDRREHKHKHKHKERDRERDRDRDRDKDRERGRDRGTGKDVDKVDAERDSSRRNDRDRDHKRDRRDRHKDQSQDTRDKPADRSIDGVRQAERRSPRPADARDDDDRHASHLDAPEAASKQPAEKGQLIFLCGGDKDLYEEATPLLKVMGKAQFFLGEVGACTPGLAPPCAGTEPCKMNSTLASPNPGLVSPNHSWPQLSQ